MGAPAFDLQSHSTCSDGELAPAEVVRAAARAGVELLALSDHDTVAGVTEALAQGGRSGIAVVPAVEISARDPGGDDLHVLGYLIDHRDGRLAARLDSYRADRERRAQRMAARLEELGFALRDEELQRRRAAGEPLGRPHLAAAALAHPANERRLSAEGIGGVGGFIGAYLVPGAPAFEPRLEPTVADAIAAIHDAGGLAVWAHPFWDVEDPAVVAQTIERHRGLGIDGVEVFYPTHTREQVQLLADTCARLGLLRTGSADFHGPSHELFARFRAFELHGREPALGPIAGAAAGGA